MPFAMTPREEEVAFWDWLEATYGAVDAIWKQLALGPKWRESWEFTNWVDIGRPKSGWGVENTGTAGVFAKIPGLQEAVDVFDKTGDRTAIDRIMAEYRNTITPEEVTNDPIISGWDIVNKNGLLVLVWLDENGNQIISPATPPEIYGYAPAEMTEQQAGMLAYYVSTVALGYAQEKGAALRAKLVAGASAAELAEMSRQYDEQWGENGWRRELEEATLAIEQGNLDVLQQRADIEQASLDWQKEAEAARLALEEKKYLAGLKARPGSWIEAYEFEHGTAPPTPSWLPEYAPGETAGGIKGEGIKTPSAQAYGKMPWGQREMLGGYAEFANKPGSPQNIQEIGERVGGTLPTERTKQARWQPTRQV